MTSSQYETIKYFIEAAIIIVAGKDLIYKKDEIWYRRISILGWILVILAISSFVTSILKSGSDSEEKLQSKHDADSIREDDRKKNISDVQKALNAKNFSYNPVTKTITVIDSSKKIIDPEVDVCIEKDSINPRLIKYKDANSLQIRIKYGVTNKGTAYNIIDSILMFGTKNNIIRFLNNPKRLTNETLKSYGNVAIELKQPFFIPAYITIQDTLYFYFKCVYHNKPIGGTAMTHLRKMYFTIIKANPRTIDDFTQVKEIESQDEYLRLKHLLITNNRY